MDLLSSKRKGCLISVTSFKNKTDKMEKPVSFEGAKEI